MASKNQSVDEQTELARLELATSLSREAYYAVALQCRRLQSEEPEDAYFLFRKWMDFQFLIVALWRLRTSTLIAAKFAISPNEIGNAIQKFDQTLPDLRKMRNVAEHIDDYAVESTRRKHLPTPRQLLECGTFDGTLFQWLGSSLDTKVALLAAGELWEAVRNFSIQISQQD